MSKDNDSFDDPKAALIFVIIEHDNYITHCLENLEESGIGTGFHKEITRASLAMALLFRRLDLTGEPEMIKLRDNITLLNYADINPEYILSAYAVYHEFLNRTYLADYKRPKPKYGKDGNLKIQ